MNVFPEDSIDVTVLLRKLLSGMVLVLLSLTLYLTITIPSSNRVSMLNTSPLPVGPWRWGGNIYTYLGGDSLEVISREGHKFFRAAFKGESKELWSGVAFTGNVNTIPDAKLKLEWRIPRGEVINVQVDIVDGSPTKKDVGKGEIFSVLVPAPKGNEWKTTEVPLSAFFRNKYQAKDNPSDGKLDTTGIYSIEFLFEPENSVDLDIKSIEFVWGHRKWPSIISIFGTSLLGVLLLLRTSNITISIQGKRFFTPKVSNRFVFLLFSTSMSFTLVNIGFKQTHLPETVIFASISLMILFDEFVKLRFSFFYGWFWELRYLLLFIIGWTLGADFYFASLFFLIVSLFIPVIGRAEKRALIIAYMIAIVLFYFYPPFAEFETLLNTILFLLFVAGMIALLYDMFRSSILKREAASLSSLYETVLDNSSDAIYMLDYEGNITNVNRGFENLVGQEKEKVLGRSILDYLIQEDSESMEGKLRSRQKESRQYDIGFVNSAEQTRFTMVREQPVFRGERLLGFHAIVTDITERKEIEDALRKSNEELNRIATEDALTKVFNRRHFDTVFSREWMRARRNNHSIALIFGDIDYFKQYNDTYGHQLGDQCLELVASTIKNRLRRASDLVARYGGEEFAMLLVETDLKHAVEIAEMLKIEIIQLGIPHETSEIEDHVTMSFGVSWVIPDGNHSPDELISSADQALYRAKEMGRNQVILSDFFELKNKDGDNKDGDR